MQPVDFDRVCSHLGHHSHAPANADSGTGLSLPVKAVGVAVVCGICATVAFLAFQVSLRIGKVTVAWLMMNLSTGLPAITLIWVYHEKLTPLRIVAFALALIAVLCLFWGRRIEQRAALQPWTEQD